MHDVMSFAPREVRPLTASELRVAELVRALPSPCRQVLTLRFVYRLSQSEIAERLDLPAACVTETLALGLRRVAETREKWGVRPGH